MDVLKKDADAKSIIYKMSWTPMEGTSEDEREYRQAYQKDDGPVG